jgi:DNA-binding IscR family transcriptional regulator
VAYKYYESCNFCKDEETCGIRSIFKEVRDESVRLLKKTTIAGILKRESKLKAIIKRKV